MSNPKTIVAKDTGPAEVFAALGDPVRLWILRVLCDGRQHSITRMWLGTHVSRQAVTKHLRVLERAGLVERHEFGREVRYNLKPEGLDEAQDFLDLVHEFWEKHLARSRDLVGE